MKTYFLNIVLRAAVGGKLSMNYCLGGLFVITVIGAHYLLHVCVERGFFTYLSITNNNRWCFLEFC
jgi:hypothetical protein